MRIKSLQGESEAGEKWAVGISVFPVEARFFRDSYAGSAAAQGAPCDGHMEVTSRSQRMNLAELLSALVVQKLGWWLLESPLTPQFMETSK